MRSTTYQGKSISPITHLNRRVIKVVRPVGMSGTEARNTNLNLSPPPNITLRYIKFSDSILVVGVYFRPGMDMEEILSTLTDEVDKAPNNHRKIVGDDFNVHPDSERFSEIRELL